MYPIAQIAIPVGASAAGSAMEEGRPVSRAIVVSSGDRRSRAGLTKRIVPDTLQSVAKSLSWRRTDIFLGLSEDVGQGT
jgi:hypothetical protein